MTVVTIERGTSTLVAEIDGPTGAPAVTLAHAQTLNRSSWDRLSAELTDRFRVLRLDLRGHGESSKPTADFTIEDLADDVVAMLDELGIETTHFAGASLGGMVGFALAIDQPDRLRSVTFVATQGVLPAESRDTLRANAKALSSSGESMSLLADKILARYTNDGFATLDPAGFGRLRAQISSTSVEGYVRSSRAIVGMDFDDRLDGITVPTMVIAGELDQPTPPHRMELYRDNIAGARMAVIAGAGHFPFADQPEDFNRTFAEFVDGIHSGR